MEDWFAIKNVWSKNSRTKWQLFMLLYQAPFDKAKIGTRPPSEYGTHKTVTARFWS